MAAAEIRQKLSESIAEATKLASKEPARYNVGSIGWVKVILGSGGPPPMDVLERWIDESYRAVADPRLVDLLPVRGRPAAKKKIATKRR